MRISRHFFTSISIIFVFTAFGQQDRAQQGFSNGQKLMGLAENNLRLATLYQNMDKKLNNDKISLSDIEGSPYFDEEFKKGKIRYENEEIGKSVLLRYNAYNDEVEISLPEVDQRQAVLKRYGISCVMGNQVIIFSDFIDSKSETKKGNIFLLYEGSNYSLFERKTKVFKIGEKAKTSFHTASKNKFVEKTGYLIAKKDGLPTQLDSSNKKIIQLFDDGHREALKSYVKQNKLKLNEKEDLLQTLKFANSL
ncbi:hypothetical protein [Allomuricauda sp. SCSIO 65647]|uniref:hypothetical protein n=1 Tax=Allomuricauda sp. SCSIO 65647 TaxID=2908843 RepID=UPI001F24AD9D|nr:hypothetical protein [Muricauda sp. SCSIO 65647]UJH67156.1 hypothetical protein L0P89_14540 [Muricauda sp. SCSIO 65647]